MIEGHGERRRANDVLLVEMHGMLTTLTERLKDHVQWDERVHAETTTKIVDLDDRMEPVEQFHGSMRTAGKVGAIVATPALLAVGAGLWEWVRNIFTHSKVP